MAATLQHNLLGRGQAGRQREGHDGSAAGQASRGADGAVPTEPVSSADGRDVGQRRKPTLAVIAAEAGVSLPTVSKVVNGRPDVAPGTRARVERLLDELRYHRPGGRRGRRAGLVDVIFNGLDSPWAVEILRGVEDWCSAHAMGAAVSAIRHGSARPASWTSTLASHDTDGVILVTSELTT
ncbi:MAG: LacI family DNA-binding transcriptional regulator, partial [Actinobacteria bacterium]|nr:LacI family DNA-binding transcriptional regulator [Actinomycetota bacterium]